MLFPLFHKVEQNNANLFMHCEIRKLICFSSQFGTTSSTIHGHKPMVAVMDELWKLHRFRLFCTALRNQAVFSH